MRNKRNTGGFTLIELVIVLAVMTILAGISLPSLSGYVRHAGEMERVDQEKLVQKAINQYYAFEGNYPDLADLDGTHTYLLNDEQKGELQRKLRSVSAALINISDYQYEYNEGTGLCTLTRN